MRKDRLISEVLGGEQTITPSDLYSKEFRKAFWKGYNIKEVDEYIERVADVFEGLVTQARESKEQIEALKKQIDEFHDVENALRNALVSSQRFSEEAIESAKREAELIIEEARLARQRADIEALAIKEEARLESQRVRAEAERLPDTIAEAIRRLEEKKERLREDLRAILASHQALLEGTDPPAHFGSMPVFETAFGALPSAEDNVDAMDDTEQE